MKKLKWNNLGGMLFLTIFLAACGSDDNQTVGTNNQSINTQTSTNVDQNKQSTTVTNTHLKSVSSFNEFKNIVNSGGFISISNFKSSLNIGSVTNFNLYYRTCTIKTWDAHVADKNAGFWSKVGDFFTPSINMGGCFGHFERSFQGESVTREDYLSKEQALEGLKDMVNNGQVIQQAGYAAMLVRYEGADVLIDLNFPIEANPVFGNKFGQ